MDMKRHWKIWILWVVIGVLVTGCGGSGGKESPREYQSFEAVPVEGLVGVPREQARTSIADVSPDGTRITLVQGADLAGRVKEGSILAIGATSKTPYGLLVQVVSKNGNTLTTQKVPLTRAFKEFHLHMGHQVNPGDARVEPLISGLSVKRSGLSNGSTIPFKFDTVLYDADGNKDTRDDQLRAKGELDIGLYYHLDVDFNMTHTRVVEVDSGVEIQQFGDLRVFTTWDGMSFEMEAPVAKVTLPPIDVGGIIPIWVTPIIELDLDASGELKARITAEVSDKVTVSAGLKYEEGQWSPYASKDIQYSYQPPKLEASADIKASLGPKFTLLIEGLVGPWVSVDGYVEFMADTQDDPWWTLWAGFEGFVGIDAELLGVGFHYQSDDLIGYREKLADAGGPFTPACTPKTCEDLGYECGQADDGCGGTLDCGTCPDGKSCQDHRCVEGECQPKICEDLGYECGKADDGCGGILDCGGCEETQICRDHRCVDESPEGVWTDPESGLMWQVQGQDNEGKRFTWQEAEEYCGGLKLGGYSDWHLPTISELRSLIRGCEKTRAGGECNMTDDCLAHSCWSDACTGCEWGKGPSGSCYWPDAIKGNCGSYWSSSLIEGESDLALYVGFASASIHSNRTENSMLVRCVRASK